MHENKSIWIQDLKRTRKIHVLKGALETDALIVGGGIAGASTLFYTLRDTDKKAILIDSHLVGHGATGHNAGQLYGGFEEHISQRIAYYGPEQALAGERALETGWGLLDEVYKASGSATPKELFLAYGGYSKLSLIISNIETYCYYQDQAGVPFESFLIARESGIYEKIPPQYRKYCSLIAHSEILYLLETKDKRYVAALPLRSGSINSAQLAEDIVSHCLKRYPDRCKVFENSPIHEVVVGAADVRSSGKGLFIRSKETVLCTNGFDHFKIVNAAGADINTDFHHKVRGLVNYMASYKTDSGRTPAIHWFHEPDQAASSMGSEESLYYYYSRSDDAGGNGSCVSIGGVEKDLPDRKRYDRNEMIGKGVAEEIDGFIRRTFLDSEKTLLQNVWHGLLGYTPQGVRLIGREVKNPRLLYNLGCNGIGILASVFGGEKIARHLRGEKVEKTIFDPR